MKLLKLIWDFKGNTALETAKHYEIHLKEFMALHQIPYTASGFEIIQENEHAIAFVVVSEENMLLVRNTLKPQRGTHYTMKNKQVNCGVN